MAYSDRSKGKGKGKSRDLSTQSANSDDNVGFDYAYAAPRTSATEPWAVLPQTYLPDQVYPPDEHYSLDANGQSPGNNSSQPWSDDGNLSLSGLNISGAELLNYTSNMSSGVSISANSNWDVLSSAASSYAPSYAPRSAHQPPSTASSPPPRYNFDNVNTQINSQRPANQRYQLPCEIQGCNESFAGDEEAIWVEHTEGHLGGSFPPKLLCCKYLPCTLNMGVEKYSLTLVSGFNCEFRQFDSKSPIMGGDTRYNFIRRMQHIREHILDGYQPGTRLPDGFLVEHLKKQGMIDKQTHRDWLTPIRVPALVSGHGSPGSSSSRHHHRSQQKHLPMVEEEAGASGPREHRTEKKSERKEHRRDSHHSHHRKKPEK